jgi:hypothetical protein
MNDDIRIVCVEVKAEVQGAHALNESVNCFRAKFLRGHDAADPKGALPLATLEVVTAEKGRYRVGRTYALTLAEAQSP